jgi:hypothetical protein
MGKSSMSISSKALDLFASHERRVFASRVESNRLEIK